MGKNAKRRKAERRRRKAGVVRVERTDDGKTIHVAPDGPLAQSLRDQLQRFEEKFGRPPEGDDPIFFDPDADTPQLVSPAKAENAIVEAMQKIGLDPAFIYAHQQTGLIPTETNLDLLSKEDVREWEEAVDRYRKLHPEA